jgi:homoserine kinase
VSAPPRQATAFAPASIGNVAVGFDVLGQSLLGPGDRATVRRLDEPVVRITAIRGVVTELPFDATKNTAAVALTSLREALRLPFGFEVELDKGIALGSGLGGSAASAVAALVAANALLDAPVARDALYPYALDGEAAASGGRHGDNVGPQLLGGLVIAGHDRLVSVPVPKGLWAVVVHPHFVLETRKAREALRAPYAIGDFVPQSGCLALVLAGCFRGDVELIRAGLKDVLVEPRRAALIPGFALVKDAALQAGALGASISGAGPSVFGWFTEQEAAARAGQAMREAFKTVELDSDIIVSPVAGPRAELLP